MTMRARLPWRVEGPRYTPWLRRAMEPLLPLLLRWQGVARCEVEGAAELAHWIGAQQAGECRLLLAFRHPSTLDPFAMAELLWRQVPRAARQQGLVLRQPVHAQFLYDRGIPLWAGPLVGWLFSRLGGIPISRGGLDRAALRLARQVAGSGAFPLAVAPEGANNHLAEQLAPLEPGLAQLAFWCCDDLRTAGSSVPVVMVPVGLRYGLLRPEWPVIDRLLEQLEQRLGLNLARSDTAATADRYSRLIRIAEALLTLLEEFYGQLQAFATQADEPLPQRITRLRDAVLALAEQRLGLTPSGGVEERCRRIEAAAWQRMFRADLPQLDPLQRRLADWGAQESELALEHMRLAEQFASISGSYVAEVPSVDRYADVLGILWRALDWIGKRAQPLPPGVLPLKLSIQVGDPIDVSARHADYRADRRAAVQQLTGDLARALEVAIQVDGSGPVSGSGHVGSSGGQ
jgi:1-acyl-sn-glycerol-3-phosphate acyltransferase